MHFGSQLGVNELNLCLFRSLKVTISVALRLLLSLMVVMEALHLNP